LQALDGFHLHGWGNQFVMSLALAMFHSEEVTLLSTAQYSHQIDCICRQSFVCVIVPSNETSAYMRKRGIDGMLECWSRERKASANCTVMSRNFNEGTKIRCAESRTSRNEHATEADLIHHSDCEDFNLQWCVES
jgi:hypothetical protein